MRTLLATLLLSAAACQPELDTEMELELAELDAFVAQLAVNAPPPRTPPVVGGCADVAMHASNVADTFGLHVFSPGLIAQAYQSPTTTQVYAYSFQLPSADVDLAFERGVDITINDCNDVFFPTTVRRRWVAVSGTAHYLINLLGPPLPWEAPANATLTLTDLVVEDPQTGVRRRVPDLVLPDVYVGWLPG